MRWRMGVASFLAPVAVVMSAMAQTPGSDTVKAMVEKGATFLIDGIAYAFEPQPDGRYDGGQDGGGGTYRVDGKALCLTPQTYRQEICFMCPDGKKSGDTFAVDGVRGSAIATIR